MTMTIWDFLTETWLWLSDEFEIGSIDEAIRRARNVINITRQRAERWWEIARSLAIYGIIVSLVIFLTGVLIGGFTHLGWPNSVAGLLIAPILFVLLVWWTPLVAIVAVIYEIAHGKIEGIANIAVAQAKWWLGLTCGILLWQVLVSLAFTFIPYWNAPSRIPVLMLLALAMALIGIRWNNVTWYRGVIKFLVIGVFVTQVLVCFLPATATALHSKLGKTDLVFANGIKNGFTGKPQIQEKIVPFKPGQPSNSGLVAQLGDTVQYINPTATFKAPGKEKFHDISATTEHVSTGFGSIVIYGSEKEGYVQIKVIPKRT